MLWYHWRLGGGYNASEDWDWSTGDLWPSRNWNSVQALAVCRQSTVAREFTCRSWFIKESCRMVKKSVALRLWCQLCIPPLSIKRLYATGWVVRARSNEHQGEQQRMNMDIQTLEISPNITSAGSGGKSLGRSSSFTPTTPSSVNPTKTFAIPVCASGGGGKEDPCAS